MKDEEQPAGTPEPAAAEAPQPPPLNPEYTKNQTWPYGKWICTTCFQKRHFKAFRQVGQHGDADRRYDTTCYACRELERVHKEMEERKTRPRGAMRKERLAVARKRAAAKKAQKKESAKRSRQTSEQRQRVLALQREARRAELDTAKRLEQELASRELARRSLLHYIERNLPSYKAGWVHEDICRRLERFMFQVEAGQSPRLMLWVPPRHGKSEIASVNFPSWVLGKHPEWEFISTSYSADLPSWLQPEDPRAPAVG